MQQQQQPGFHSPQLTQPRVLELVSEAQGMYDEATSAFQWRATELNENMSFYLGKQWAVSSAFGWWFEDLPSEREARESYNLVRPTVRSAVSSALRNFPNPQVVARFGDSRAITRASATQKLVKSFLDNGTIPFEELYKGELNAAIHGATWYKCYFDPNLGKAEKVPKYKPALSGDWEPDIDELGVQRWHEKFEGDIRVEAVDVFDALPDPSATRESEIRYMFHRKLVPISTLEDIFPVDAFGNPTKGRWDTETESYEVSERDAIANPARAYASSMGSTFGADTDQNEIARVIELWVKPTNKNPRGMLLVYSGNMVLVISALPYEWPWVLRFGENVVPGDVYSDGIVKDIKPIQRTINLNASKKREWMDLILSPPLLVPSSSGLRRDDFSDVAGDVLTYDFTGGLPKWMDVPNIPGAMFELEATLVGILKDVSTYADISRGDAPSQIKTGRGLAYLHEFQQGVHEPDTRMVKIVVTRMLQKCLRLARDFFSDGRMIKILGNNNKWQLEELRRDDLDFEAEIEIEIDSGAPNSRALKMAENIQLLQVGAFEDTPAAKRFREVMKINTGDAEVLHWNQVHIKRAEKEQAEIVRDPTLWPEILEQDDHEVHAELHDNFAVTDEYLNLPDMARAAFDEHRYEHQMFLMEQMQNYGMQQQMLGSTSAGPPPPKQPQAPSPIDGGGGAYAGEGQGGSEPPLPQMEQSAA